jgi:hypothetical protein
MVRGGRPLPPKACKKQVYIWPNPVRQVPYVDLFHPQWVCVSWRETQEKVHRGYWRMNVIENKPTLSRSLRARQAAMRPPQGDENRRSKPADRLSLDH